MNSSVNRFELLRVLEQAGVDGNTEQQAKMDISQQAHIFMIM
jgi:hypothetical protein